MLLLQFGGNMRKVFFLLLFCFGINLLISARVIVVDSPSNLDNTVIKLYTGQSIILELPTHFKIEFLRRDKKNEKFWEVDKEGNLIGFKLLDCGYTM